MTHHRSAEASVGPTVRADKEIHDENVVHEGSARFGETRVPLCCAWCGQEGTHVRLDVRARSRAR